MNHNRINLSINVEQAAQWALYIENNEEECQNVGGRISFFKEDNLPLRKEHIKPFFTSLSRVKAPLELCFNDLNIHDQEFQTVISCILKKWNKSSCLSLNFANNCISDVGVKDLANKIGRFKGSYWFLDLMDNQITREGLRKLSKKMEAIPNFVLMISNSEDHKCEITKKIIQISSRNTGHCSLLKQSMDAENGQNLGVATWRLLDLDAQSRLLTDVYTRLWEKLDELDDFTHINFKQLDQQKARIMEHAKQAALESQAKTSEEKLDQCVRQWTETMEYYATLSNDRGSSSEQYQKVTQKEFRMIEEYMAALKRAMIGIGPAHNFYSKRDH